MRVAVVHDWLTGMRGGEKVLEAILELYPGSEIFTLFHFPGSVSERIEAHRIYTSPLQRRASKADDYRRLLPFFPMAIGRWDFSRFDLVISSSHCVAKGVDTGEVPHICYCHTPMRYIWDRFDDYFPPERPMLRFAASVVAPYLRSWDRKTAGNVDRFVANSNFVRERILRHYGADAAVVHPFVDDSFLRAPLERDRDGYHVIVSALVPYKRIELAIASKKRLVIVGRGPLGGELRRSSGPNVELLGFVSEERLREILSRAQSLVLPGVEDFGITCLEAMALGTPVVAYAAGGALDSVVDGATGILFREQNVPSLLEAMERAEQIGWDRDALRVHAARFSKTRFQREFLEQVEQGLEARRASAALEP
jgi:glycosyltransferase involved in cell wall biosynthesis